MMKTTICGAALLLSLTMASCEVYESPEINQGLNEENNTSLYADAYDPISNVGQYYMPEMKVKPKKYWNCVEVVTVGSRNELGQTDKMRGLQYHLLCQSLAGLTNRAVEQGKSEIAVWLHDPNKRLKIWGFTNREGRADWSWRVMVMVHLMVLLSS